MAAEAFASRSGRFFVLILICAAIVGVGVGTAYAAYVNTHTVGNWYHGLGDGTDNDSYVHPFMDNTANSAISNAFFLQRDNNSLYGNSCVCSHNHVNWDTSPYNECRYSTVVSGNGSGSNFLNGHEHFHKYYCGA